jgi:hypothetical protein
MKVEAGDTLFSVWQKIKGPLSEVKEVVLEISAGNEALGNILALKLLRKEARKRGGKINFKGVDEQSQNLASILRGQTMPAAGADGLGFKEGVDIAAARPSAKRPSLSAILHSPRFRRAALLLSAAAALVVILFVGLFTVPKAKIVLTVDSESLVQSYEVFASPSATAVDKEKRILPAVLLTVEERGEDSAAATGKKEKGEKARGEVTIYNWTDDPQDFDAGTPITYISVGDEKLRFLLDEDVTVPPQEASVSATTEKRITTYKPGKTSAKVTAEEIGEQYNLKADSQFSLAGLSTDDFLAQNDEQFSGGKKEEIKVVTAEDQRRLKARLEDDLKKKAREDLLSRTVGDQKLLETAVLFETLGETYSHQVDEEAEEFTLTLRIGGSGLLYSEETLNELITELLKENVPEDYDLSDGDLTVDVGAVSIEKPEGVEEPMLKIFAKVKSSVVPTYDKEKIKKQLLGLTIGEAQKTLEALPNVFSVRVSLFPPLPGPFRRIPRVAERVEIVVERQ